MWSSLACAHISWCCFVKQKCPCWEKKATIGASHEACRWSWCGETEKETSRERFFKGAIMGRWLLGIWGICLDVLSSEKKLSIPVWPTPRYQEALFRIELCLCWRGRGECVCRGEVNKMDRQALHARKENDLCLYASSLIQKTFIFIIRSWMFVFTTEMALNNSWHIWKLEMIYRMTIQSRYHFFFSCSSP